MLQRKLLVQEFLETRTFQDLIDSHGVYASPSKCGSKISLNYSQIESSNSDKLSQQCRGLILRRASGKDEKSKVFDLIGGKLNLKSCPGKTSIVAYPFNRFFNYGMEDAKIDWSDNNLRVVEKLDGTLIIFYYDDLKKEWHCATRAVPEADVDGGNGFTFRGLVEDALREQYGITSFKQLCGDISNTYMCELTSYYNRIVVDHKCTSLTLLGARNNYSFNEIDVNSLNLLYAKINNNIVKINAVKQHPLSNIKDIVSHVEAQNPLDSEGVIAIDSNFNRVKVKSAAYVSLHHTISSIGSSNRNLLTLILLEKDDDVVANLPEKLSNKLNLMKLCFNNYAKLLNVNYSMLKEISEKAELKDKRKEFALLLKSRNISWQAPYFAMYSGKVSNFFEYIKISKNSENNDWSVAFKDKMLDELQKNGMNIE